jgi:hypothetical protein
MYTLKNGTEVTEAEIEAAFNEGRAVIIHVRREGNSKTGLLLDAVHFDTRGKCVHALDETWTSSPKTLEEALDAAVYNPFPFCKV